MAQDKGVHDFLSKLKSSSITYDDLVEIKSKVVSTREGAKLIIKNDLLKDLVNFMDKPNEKILDITLSILGNCCLDEDTRKEVVCLGIVKKLSFVLHNIVKDSIQCRACRLAGNLAQESAMAEELLQESILIDIISMLEITSKSSIATKQMAVRALRMLWTAEDEHSHMLKLKAVRAVSRLLNLDQKRSDERELLKAVIKALVIFSNNHSVQCSEQICGDGSIFKHLMALTLDPTLKKSVLIIICNLCYTKNARPGLGSAGAVQLVIKELKNGEENNEGLFITLVRALCLFCNESVNRAAIRYAGGLPLMLKIIRSSSKPTVSSFILQALAQFMYDDVSLWELSKEGLVSVLVQKIIEFVKEHGEEHFYEDTLRNKPSSYCTAKRTKRTIPEDKDQETPRQRFRANSPSYQEVVREQGNSSRSTSSSGDIVYKADSPSENRFFSQENCYTGDWSPGSPNSMCFSPSASPPQRSLWGSSTSSGLSPNTSPNERFDDKFDFPEAYSPICSDQEDDDDIDHDNENTKNSRFGNITDDETENDIDGEGYMSTEENNKNEKQISVSSVRLEHNILSPVLILLSRLSCMDSPMEELASPTTIAALLDYMTLIDNAEPRSHRILFRIIRNHHYFMHLMQNKFVFMVKNKLLDSTHDLCCVRCVHFKKTGRNIIDEIRLLAQSAFGLGELSHQLLKGDDCVRRVLAISIAYVADVQRLLVKLLLDCGGLRYIFEILKNYDKEDDELFNHIPMALNYLGYNLQIPKLSHENKVVGMAQHNEYPDNMEVQLPSTSTCNADKPSDDKIFLQLDDGSAVKVSKSYLSQQSPVFEAMFRGDFRESQEECVPLPGISLECLVNVFRILKHGGVPEVLPGITLSLSLDLVAMLDRFLIPGSQDVNQMILRRFLTVGTALDIYIRCIEAGDVLHFHQLRRETVKFIIMSGDKADDVIKLYKDILQNPYRLEVLTDMTDELEERLKQPQSL